MKIFLDDSNERLIPRDYLKLGSDWVRATNADECIQLLKDARDRNIPVDFISLDHDLEDFRQDPYPREVTGMDVVDWMVRENYFPAQICIHSHNYSRAKEMVARLKDSGTQSLISYRPYSY